MWHYFLFPKHIGKKSTSCIYFKIINIYITTITFTGLRISNKKHYKLKKKNLYTLMNSKNS